jgi:phosphatidate cytidylyltransferase
LLAPAISPKKTWEGAIANLIASCFAGLIVGLLLGYSAGIGLACGAAVGIVGQLGDLFESALKRSAGQKDSGSLLPGHGGLLDRIDSLIACVLPVWLVLWLAEIV